MTDKSDAPPADNADFDPQTHFEPGVPYSHLMPKRNHSGMRFPSQARRPSWHRGYSGLRPLPSRKG